MVIPNILHSPGTCPPWSPWPLYQAVPAGWHQEIRCQADAPLQCRAHSSSSPTLAVFPRPFPALQLPNPFPQSSLPVPPPAELPCPAFGPSAPSTQAMGKGLTIDPLVGRDQTHPGHYLALIEVISPRAKHQVSSQSLLLPCPWLCPCVAVSLCGCVPGPGTVAMSSA